MTPWESLKHGLSSALEALLPAKTAHCFFRTVWNSWGFGPPGRGRVRQAIDLALAWQAGNRKQMEVAQ